MCHVAWDVLFQRFGGRVRQLVASLWGLAECLQRKLQPNKLAQAVLAAAQQPGVALLPCHHFAVHGHSRGRQDFSFCLPADLALRVLEFAFGALMKQCHLVFPFAAAMGVPFLNVWRQATAVHVMRLPYPQFGSAHLACVKQALQQHKELFGSSGFLRAAARRFQALKPEEKAVLKPLCLELVTRCCTERKLDWFSAALHWENIDPEIWDLLLQAAKKCGLEVSRGLADWASLAARGSSTWLDLAFSSMSSDPRRALPFARPAWLLLPQRVVARLEEKQILLLRTCHQENQKDAWRQRERQWLQATLPVSVTPPEFRQLLHQLNQCGSNQLAPRDPRLVEWLFAKYQFPLIHARHHRVILLLLRDTDAHVDSWTRLIEKYKIRSKLIASVIEEGSSSSGLGLWARRFPERAFWQNRWRHVRRLVHQPITAELQQVWNWLKERGQSLVEVLEYLTYRARSGQAVIALAQAYGTEFTDALAQRWWSVFVIRFIREPQVLAFLRAHRAHHHQQESLSSPGFQWPEEYVWLHHSLRLRDIERLKEMQLCPSAESWPTHWKLGLREELALVKYWREVHPEHPRHLPLRFAVTLPLPRAAVELGSQHWEQVVEQLAPRTAFAMWWYCSSLSLQSPGACGPHDLGPDVCPDVYFDGCLRRLLYQDFTL